MIKTVAAVVVMLVAFLAGIPVALVAVGGAACTLLTRRVKPAKVYREINWELLVLFTGLFVLIGGVESSGPPYPDSFSRAFGNRAGGPASILPRRSRAVRALA
jgi:hypothetical protein